MIGKATASAARGQNGAGALEGGSAKRFILDTSILGFRLNQDLKYRFAVCGFFFKSASGTGACL
jgi:hypothetical protein